MTGLSPSFWKGKSVFVTGHTGFKGGWLATWLIEMDADVCGYALAPVHPRSYFVLCDLERKMKSVIGDIRDASALTRSIQSARPELVIHLAAQPLVRRSYIEPLATFETNVMGTANLLEALRQTPSVRAAVIVTSDKCYYPSQIPTGYQERDHLGGLDPYSSSKASAELVVAAYTHSYFDRSTNPIAVATARAGNVIGGGDWAENRIVPDTIRALVNDEPLAIRNPASIRPWQHVLEPLAGYLTLARHLLEDGLKWAGAWNFGPASAAEVTVATLADLLIARWGTGSWCYREDRDLFPETHFLRLNSMKAMRELGWAPRLTIEDAISLTVDWYRRALLLDSDDMYAFSAEQIRRYYEPLATPVSLDFSKGTG